jgi:predicted nuclease of predicted toxin-antitoxin system
MRKAPHCGIVRIVNFRASRQGRVCIEILARYAEELQQAGIITAEPGRIRIRQQSST